MSEVEAGQIDEKQPEVPVEKKEPVNETESKNESEAEKNEPETVTDQAELNESEKNEPEAVKLVSESEKNEAEAGNEKTKTENNESPSAEKKESEDLEQEKKESEEEEPTPVERTKGTVFQYYNRKGYGFVIPSGGEERDKVFVHWKSILTSDRWPSLNVGQEVEYTLSFAEKGRKLAAIDVSEIDGSKVSIEKDLQFVTKERFAGRVKFYDIQKGYGFIELSVEARVNDEILQPESDVHVGREHIITTDNCPALLEGMEVEFNLAKIERKITALQVTEKGKENVSAPQAFSRNNYNRNRDNRNFRNRDNRDRRDNFRRGNNRRNMRRDRRPPQAEINHQIHTGTIASFNTIKGFGWITPKEDLSECGVNMEENGGKLFVHRNDLQNVHSVEGTEICFQLKFDNGSCTAVNVTPSQQFITDFNPYVISVQILESQVGSIIGRKGANIRQLQRTCKAQVQVKDPSEQNKGKRIINITGNPQHIKHACQLIHQKLYEKSEEEIIQFTFLFHDMYNQLSADGAAQSQFDKIPSITAACTKTFQIQGTQMSSLDLEGAKDVIKQGIEHAVDVLCKLYMDTLSDYFQQISSTQQQYANYYQGYYNQFNMQQQQQPF